MRKILNVAEKPSIAKALANALCPSNELRLVHSFSKYNCVYSFKKKFLSKDSNILVTSVTGHITELVFQPPYNNWHANSKDLILIAKTIQNISEDKIDIVKTIKVNSIEIRESKQPRGTFRSYNVFFNEYPVDSVQDITIYDEKNDDSNITTKSIPIIHPIYDKYILGIPSGEIIFIDKDTIKHLESLGFVSFQDEFKIKNEKILYKVYLFADRRSEDILDEIHEFNRELEEHEIDDMYHIKNLHKNSK